MASSQMRVSGQYGKTKVRIVRVRRVGATHHLCELEAEVLLKGEFDMAYLAGDNSNVIPTDTIKNTCYVIAKTSKFESQEDYGIALIKDILSRHSHVTEVTVNLQEKLWQRVVIDSKGHSHVFKSIGPEIYTSQCVGRQGSIIVRSGIKDWKIMKTTGSGFEHFRIDKYTSLKPTRDRIFCTSVTAIWLFRCSRLPEGRFNEINEGIRHEMMRRFSGPPFEGEYSKSVQETMYKMGYHAIEGCDLIESVKLVMPNIHHFPYDLQRFNIKNNNEIFFPTDDPSGLIECTVYRSNSRL